MSRQLGQDQSGISIPVNLKIPYSLDQFEQDVSRLKPRAFDTFLLPPFMMWFAAASKSGMGRWPRRILFTAGLYMVYRNFSEYRKAIASFKEKISAQLAQDRGPAAPELAVEYPEEVSLVEDNV